MPSTKGWIGVDFDGTLVEKADFPSIGEPIPKMVERVKSWLRAGKNVRIFTARVASANDDVERQKLAAINTLVLQQWCEENLGEILPVTCQKDADMIEIWDDRCRQVEPDTGELA